MGSLLLTIIYICFISLGLPDSLLGSAWPVLHAEIHVPNSYAGILSTIICAGTILSSLFSGKLLSRFRAGKITVVSIMMTALGLFGFSVSNEFWMLVLWAIPYGLGAGGVDSVLNNYVAVHYKAQHMSWIHCMWGVGATISPYIMSFSLLHLKSWSAGYLIVSVIQVVVTAGVFISLPIWKKEIESKEGSQEEEKIPVSFKDIFSVKGAIPCFLGAFFYCALELTSTLWASSYLVQKWAFTPELAAGFASMFYIGITVGRFVNGFLAMKFKDCFLIRMGIAIITVGIGMLFVPFHVSFTLIGFALIGLGGAPIYPCLIHITPEIFGKERSQAMIGTLMAFAYTGFLTMPPLFGVIADSISISLLPIYLLILFVIMLVMCENVIGKKVQI